MSRIKIFLAGNTSAVEGSQIRIGRFQEIQIFQKYSRPGRL
jgi:hypothetical protein